MGQREGGDIAVVGATGAVGREVLSILADRGVDPSRIRCLASDRSAGEAIPFGDTTVTVSSLTDDSFDGVALGLFMASAEVARTHIPRALAEGARIVDNSSAFRLDASVPLIIPEVNGNDIGIETRLIANPNCSTIILLGALEPVRRAFGVVGIDVATYQAVSGAGLSAMDELREQAQAALDGRTVEPRVFAEPCAFNVFSHDSPVDPETGVNGEERKIIDESRRIWNDPGLRVTPTCVRVPVFRSHTQAITVTLGRTATEREVREALAGARGVRIVDDRAANRFPTPLGATGGDDILIGRIRPDPSGARDDRGGTDRWCLLVAGDQLRKGAALNAVQVADCAWPGLLQSHLRDLNPGPVLYESTALPLS